jgi:O-antigen ligase
MIFTKDRLAHGRRLKTTAYFSLFAALLSAPVSISLFEISAGILIGSTILSILVNRDGGRLNGPLLWTSLLYLLFNLLSLTQTDYLVTSLRGALKIVENIALCFCAFYVLDTREKWRRAAEWILWVAIFVSIDAILQGFLGRDVLRGNAMTPYYGQTKRLTGPFKHANDFAAYLSFAAVYSAALFRDSYLIFKGRKAFVAAGAAVLSLGCLVGTYSRGAWIAAAIALMLYLMTRRSKVLSLLAISLIVFGLFFAPAKLKDRAFSIFDAKNNTFLERKDLWGESVRMIKQSPFLGHGANTYARIEPQFKEAGSKTDFQYAHNGYLQMAADIGLLGLASFLVVMLSALGLSLFSLRNETDPCLKWAGRAAAFGIFSFLIHSATDTNLQSILLVNSLWIWVGILWAAGRISKEGRPE